MHANNIGCVPLISCFYDDPLSADGELLFLAVRPAVIILWKLTRAIFSYKCEENSPVVHLPKGGWLGKYPDGRGEGILLLRIPCLYPAGVWSHGLFVCLFWDPVIMCSSPVIPNLSFPCSWVSSFSHPHLNGPAGKMHRHHLGLAVVGRLFCFV